MRSNRYPFHIQHNTGLSVISQVVSCGDCGSLTARVLAERTGKLESDILKRIRAPLAQMDVLREWRLTPYGKRLVRLQSEQPDLLGEAMHTQIYTLHWRNPSIYFSFAYATLCDWLCDRGTFTLDDHGQATLVNVVLNNAAETYGLDPAEIAFSKTSVQGAMHWLEATEPPVLVDRRFQVRYAAPVHTLLWVVNVLYTRKRIRHGTRLSLDPETEATLCHAMLLAPDALYHTLEVTQRAHDYRRGGFFGTGTEGGFGRWLLLIHPIPVGALEPVPIEETFTESEPDEAVVP